MHDIILTASNNICFLSCFYTNMSVYLIHYFHYRLKEKTETRIKIFTGRKEVRQPLSVVAAAHRALEGA